MLTLAYFGIESSGLNLAIDLLILFVAVLYLSLIYWTYADARRRIYDPMLVFCATAASVFPFVGTIIYMVLRPPEYLDDVRERELETQAAEARLRELDHSLCPHCDYRVERDFIRCPSCMRKLKERCPNCSRPLDRAWTVCPYCEVDVPGIAAPPRSRRRRAAAARESEPADPDDAVAAKDLDVPATEPALATETVDPPLSAEPAVAPRRARAGRPGGRPRSSS
jgi:hypothetical protein